MSEDIESLPPLPTNSAKDPEYFSSYFTWYDTEYYHSGMDYVTPQQAHEGLRPSIVEQQRIKKLAERRRRREETQKQKTGIAKTKN